MIIDGTQFDANTLLAGWTLARITKDGNKLVIEVTKGTNAAKLVVGWYDGDKVLPGQPRPEAIHSGVVVQL